MSAEQDLVALFPSKFNRRILPMEKSITGFLQGTLNAAWKNFQLDWEKECFSSEKSSLEN